MMTTVVASGFIGAIASILGKVSFSKSTPVMTFLQTICETLLTANNGCWNFMYAARLISFFVMFYFNALALSLFLRALESKGSLVVTVVSSATNFLVTGLLSGVLLGERVGLQWCLGAALIAVGVYLIAASQGSHSSKQQSIAGQGQSAGLKRDRIK
jgi:drug/metabolite transporter (DMT)-like permease